MLEHDFNHEGVSILSQAIFTNNCFKMLDMHENSQDLPLLQLAPTLFPPQRQAGPGRLVLQEGPDGQVVRVHRLVLFSHWSPSKPGTSNTLLKLVFGE